jgi:hypothetical protein
MSFEQYQIQQSEYKDYIKIVVTGQEVAYIPTNPKHFEPALNELQKVVKILNQPLADTLESSGIISIPEKYIMLMSTINGTFEGGKFGISGLTMLVNVGDKQAKVDLSQILEQVVDILNKKPA